MGYRFKTPVVVSFGEEAYFLDKDLALFQDQTAYSVVTLDGSDVTDAEVVSVCETVQIDFDDPSNLKPKAVVLDNAGKLKGDKALKAYLESRDPQDLSVVLAAVVRSDKCPAIWSKLGKKATVVERKKLKTWDNNNEVVAWVMAEAERLGLKLDIKIATSMFQVVGSNFYVLASELSKLRVLVGAGARVTVDHLKLVMTPSTTAGSWDVADAVFLRNRGKAMNLLSNIFKFASEDPTLMILGSLMKSSERLFVARAMKDRGSSDEEIAARFGMHPFRYKMALLPQVEKQDLKTLTRSMKMLSKLDVELKRTSHKRTLIELAVLELAT
jgi:DNA polymerase III delta subunit